MLEYQIVLVLIVVTGLVCIGAAKLWIWSKRRQRQAVQRNTTGAAKLEQSRRLSPAERPDASDMS